MFLDETRRCYGKNLDSAVRAAVRVFAESFSRLMELREKFP